MTNNCLGLALTIMTLLSHSSSSLSSPIPRTIVTTAAPTTTTTTSTLPSSSDWKMVPFDPLHHESQLEDVCSSAGGGRDYVLDAFREYVEDPKSFFQAVIKESKDNSNENDESLACGKAEVDEKNKNNDITLGAVGNLRFLGQGQAWIEAIRTSGSHRNQGLATRLLHGLLDVAATNNECKLVLSCTSRSNDPMLHVFEKVGMRKLTYIKMVKFTELRKLPGWSATSTSKRTTTTTTAETEKIKTQHLLHAFGIKDLVSCKAKSFEWSPVHNVDEIQNILRNIEKQGGAGFIPGLYEVVGVDSLLDKDGPLDNELVFSLTKRKPTVNGSVIDDDKDGSGDAIICFKRDSRISSLKSKWVLSIAGTREELVQAALWYACSPCIQKKLIEVEKRIASSKLIDGSDIDKNLIDDYDHGDDSDEIGFVVAMESAIPTDGSFFAKLPLIDDCVVYGTSL